MAELESNERIEDVLIPNFVKPLNDESLLSNKTQYDLTSQCSGVGGNKEIRDESCEKLLRHESRDTTTGNDYKECDNDAGDEQDDNNESDDSCEETVVANCPHAHQFVSDL